MIFFVFFCFVKQTGQEPSNTSSFSVTTAKQLIYNSLLLSVGYRSLTKQTIDVQIIST